MHSETFGTEDRRGENRRLGKTNETTIIANSRATIMGLASSEIHLDEPRRCYCRLRVSTCRQVK